MDFEKVFKLLVEKFEKSGIDFALIGGFAMHVRGYSRTTQDIDFLVSKEHMPKVKKIMKELDYEMFHESEDVSSFAGPVAPMGRVDFLHAHRKHANKMLERAGHEKILGGAVILKVLKAEDIIGLKVQSSSNDPSRYHQDMADIQALLRYNIKNLDLNVIREYFEMFGRTQELENTLKIIKDAQV